MLTSSDADSLVFVRTPLRHEHLEGELRRLVNAGEVLRDSPLYCHQLPKLHLLKAAQA